MSDPQALFREGVLALRERRDVAEGRRLLIEALRADPRNDMAWVWLARTTTRPDKRLECLDRALQINPANPQALEMKASMTLVAATPAASGKVAAEADSSPFANAANAPLMPQGEKRIAFLMKKADHFIEAGDPEAAIEQWVKVLQIQVDHEEALRNAVSYLVRLKYLDDARELVMRAIDAGTRHPAIYLTAIDIARREGQYGEADALRERLAHLPEVDEQVIASVAQGFVADNQVMRGLDLLLEILETRPDSQHLLTAVADIYREMDNEHEAMRYYDRAARLGAATKIGREADKKLSTYAPVLTDHERGSLLLAWREAAGFGVLFLFLGWQDAGLDLLRLGPLRWIGVALGVVGSYALVTATSSPQQQPIARWLGGQVPDKPKAKAEGQSAGNLIEEPTQLPMIPPTMRLVLALGGLLLLVVALGLVFHTAIQQLANPVPPGDIPNLYDLIYGE